MQKWRQIRRHLNGAPVIQKGINSYRKFTFITCIDTILQHYPPQTLQVTTLQYFDRSIPEPV